MARPPSHRSPTVRDVAAALGINHSTVSRAFSHPQRLKPETVERVLEAAKRLGYQPNQLARALTTGKPGNIALIVPDISNPFFPPLIRAAQRAADAAGFAVFIGDSNEDPAEEFRLAQRLSPQIDGFVFASSRLSEAQLHDVAKLRPTVLINREVEGLSRVQIDPGIGLTHAVEHLKGLGHKHIVYLAGPAASWSDQQRRAVLVEAARVHDLKIDIAERAALDEATRFATVRDLVKTGATAAIAFDDFVAHRLLAGLAQCDIAVPRAFSVIGFDDVLGTSIFPALSSVFAPNEEAGQMAITLLLDQLSSGSALDQRERLATEFVARATTGAPPR